MMHESHEMQKPKKIIGFKLILIPGFKNLVYQYAGAVSAGKWLLIKHN